MGSKFEHQNRPSARPTRARLSTGVCWNLAQVSFRKAPTFGLSEKGTSHLVGR
jgi:hypothetical protein